MYISGNASNFMTRVHQLGTNSNDLIKFQDEAGFYNIKSIGLGLSGMWEREVKMQEFRMSGTGLTRQQLRPYVSTVIQEVNGGTELPNFSASFLLSGLSSAEWFMTPELGSGSRTVYNITYSLSAPNTSGTVAYTTNIDGIIRTKDLIYGDSGVDKIYITSNSNNNQIVFVLNSSSTSGTLTMRCAHPNA